MSDTPEQVDGLRIGLDMPSHELEKDTEKANSALDRFAKRIGITAGVAASAGTLIGTYLVRGFKYFQDQLEGAITRIDDLNDASLRIGVAVDKFSALEYAASLTGGSIASLETAFRGLNNKMDEAAQKASGGAAQSFKALGVQVKNADGTLRNADEVMLDIADKFAGMEDGARKTALAVDIFGKSGTTMIQMLNEGKVGIEALTKEAKDFGLVVDKEAAAAANKWKDDSDKLNRQLDGLWRTIAINVIPMVTQLSMEARRVALGLHGLAMETGGFIDLMVKSVRGDGVVAWIEYHERLKAVREENAKLAKELEASIAAANNRKSFVTKDGPTENPRVDTITKETEARAAQLTVEQLFTQEMMKQNAAQEYNNSIRDIEQQQYDRLNESRYLTMEQFGQLNTLLADGVIKGDQFADAMFGVGNIMNNEIGQATEKLLSNLKRIEFMFAHISKASAKQWIGMGQTMVDTLGIVFGESKELAIASALINTAGAVMKTLEVYGGTPWGWAAAAAVAAMGAAQIAKIASGGEKGGGGGSTPAPIPAASGAAAGAGGAQGASQTLFVQGIDRNSLYTGEAVRTLADELLQYQRDGGRVVLAS